ncbi:conserved hypothetical protein [Mesotoga infera]|nr:conserved hypothetical protein [Mesotoga infera]
MLVSFAIENFRSFLDETVFSMECESVSELQELNTFVSGKWCLLKSSFIYGKNAGGKSNLLKGIAKMRDILLHSFDDSYRLQTDRFAFKEGAEKRPTKFEIEFLTEFGGGPRKFRYGFEIQGGSIHSEWLFITRERETRIFLRESSSKKDIVITKKYGELKKFVEFTNPNVLFLSVINKIGSVDLVKTVFDYFLSMIIIDASRFPTSLTAARLYKDKALYEKTVNFMREADQGISGLEIRREEFEDVETYFKDITGRRNDLEIDITQVHNGRNGTSKFLSYDVFTSHDMYNDDRSKKAKIFCDLREFESEGTKKFFKILGPVVDALTHGKVILIDEIDSKLHPLLVETLIDKFNSISENSKNAQMICNTHNPLILESKKVRRDQFWFVDKNELGESSLYRLTDFTNVRKDLNLKKAYLLGQFDAIPKMRF